MSFAEIVCENIVFAALFGVEQKDIFAYADSNLYVGIPKHTHKINK